MTFQKCKIVMVGADPVQYHGARQDERGTAGFVLSSGSLREFLHCPSRWKAGYESPDSKSKQYGSLFDCRLLTPEQFASRYVIQPEVYLSAGMQCPVCKSVTDSKACRACKTERVPVNVEKPWSNQSETCAAWVADQEKAGRKVVKHAEVDAANAAIKRLLADDILGAWHAACDKQVWIAGEWKDDWTGLVIPCRCLIDYLPRIDTEFARAVGDLKSSRSAAIRPFDSWAKQMGYHVQAAWDMDMLVAATGQDRTDWCLILSENFAPYEPGRRLLSQALVQDGRLFYQGAIAQYAAALKSGRWRGYDDHPDAAQGWTVIDSDPRTQMAAMSAVPTQNESAPEDEAPADEYVDLIP